MSRVIKLGQLQARTPSSAYRFLGFASNTTTDSTWTDQSGGGRNAVLGANLTAGTAWATVGFNATTEQSTGATTKPFFQFPSTAAFDWDWQAGDSLLIFIKGWFTTPLATSTILGNGGSVASKPGIRARTFVTHKADLQLCDSAGTVTTVTATTGTPLSAAPAADTTIAWALDAGTRTASIYVNGVVDVSGFAVPASDYRTSADLFGIGGSPDASANYKSTAAKFREVHILVSRRRGLPSNIATLIATMHNVRNYALTASQFPA